MRKYLFILSAFSLTLGSCWNFGGRRVRGNGIIKTEDRSVGNFKNIEVGGDENVYISQGETSSLRIEGDENLLPLIEVTQEGDKIYIRPRQGVNLDPTHELRIYAKAPVFHDISVSGACNIIGQEKISNPDKMRLHVSGAGDIKMEVDAPELEAEISGSGSIYLKGQTRDVGLGISGAGHAHCYELLAENTKIDISGAGDAEVYASVKLDADVSGAGSVSYRGGATSINQHVSGAGSVRKAD
ncbi:MAG: DUF2807 domain-containing protein [Puia sp.]|nr:DUF2807 domain-containing protein [Puia sp.]